MTTSTTEAMRRAKKKYKKTDKGRKVIRNTKRNARKRQTAELADGYIKKLFTKGSPLEASDIPPELIKLKS